MLPYYRNNGYRPFNSFSTLFKKAPNTVVMKALDQLEHIKKACRLEGQSLKGSDRESGYGTTEEYAVENNNSFEL